MYIYNLFLRDDSNVAFFSKAKNGAFSIPARVRFFTVSGALVREPPITGSKRGCGWEILSGGRESQLRYELSAWRAACGPAGAGMRRSQTKRRNYLVISPSLAPH